METKINVPSSGESITSGILTSWLKQDGDRVKEGEILFHLETEKTTMEVPSPETGILKILVEEEADVEIGQTVGLITAQENESEPEETAPAQPQQPVAQPEQPAETAEDTPAATQDTPPHVPESPAAKPVRRLGDSESRSKRVPMTTIRKKTAERLVQAQRTAAYLTTFNEIDMQKVVDIRNQYKAEFEKEHGTRIGFMSFFVKACCQALKEYPGVNSMLDGDDIVYQYFYDIGVAISLEQGLIVPVIRDADTLCFAGIEAKIVDMAQRARNKKIKIDELIGGTFTITNGGVFGSLMSTPIPAFPQTAILGMHAIKKRPVVVDDQIMIRPMMYVALSYDHRVIDGRQAIGFLAAVKNYIEEPDKLLLEL